MISGVADRMAERIKRLVYVNAFVPLDGQSLNDMVPPHYLGLFDSMRCRQQQRGDAAVRNLARRFHQRRRFRTGEVSL